MGGGGRWLIWSFFIPGVISIQAFWTTRNIIRFALLLVPVLYYNTAFLWKHQQHRLTCVTLETKTISLPQKGKLYNAQ